MQPLPEGAGGQVLVVAKPTLGRLSRVRDELRLTGGDGG